MNPTTEQKIAIKTQDRALVVEAGAGTGKTWVLVQRFLHLLEAHPKWPLDSLIAITFTEKAAREMRTRVRMAIEAKALENPDNPHWQTHRLNLDRMQVSTIHSLCSRILRENAIAAEIDPRFQVLDQQEADLLKEEAIRETIQALDDENHPALALLASLRVYDLREEMGSMLSKRGTLNQLFTDLGEPGDLLSRWEAGLDEMRAALWQAQLQSCPDLFDRCSEIVGIQITDPTDKLAAAVQAAQTGARAASQGALVDATQAWLSINRSGGRAANWGGKDAKDYLSKELLKPMQDAAKNLEKQGFLIEIGPIDQEAAEHLHLWRKLWERLDQSYSQIKEAQQALDFDDLELLTDRLLQMVPSSHRLQGFLNHINHLMVDEFQDTNPIQQRIIYALAPLDQPGKLFVVGDAKQSIYRFRQAQVSIFNQTSKEVKEITGYPPDPLSTSFRTHHSLVQAANRLFDKILSPLGEDHEIFEAIPGPLTAHRDTHPDFTSPVEILLLPAKDQDDENINAEEARIWEAQWIAQRLITLKDELFPVWDKNEEKYRPFKFGDAAILFRATTQLPLYEAEFKHAGLPYLTVSGRGYYDRPEVQDLIALLASLANPADDLNLAASLRSPLFSLSDETLYRLRWHTPDGGRPADPTPFKIALSQPPQNDQTELVERACSILSELWTLANRVDVWSLLRKTLDLTSYEVALAKSDGRTGRQHSNVQKFLAVARDSGEINLSDFLRRLRDLKAREAREGEALGREPESGAVQLMSIHASKGLEFPVVIIADMGRQKGRGFGSPYLLHDPAFGLVCKVRDEAGDWVKPAGYAWGAWLNERMEEAESQRLLYVACTRAADLLILSGRIGGKDTWLAEILEAMDIAADGDAEETIDYDDFAIQVYRPAEPLKITKKAVESIRKNLEPMTSIPPLAQPLPVVRQKLPIAVTQLKQMIGREDSDVPAFSPAIWRHERTKTKKRATGYLIGNIVHKALAHWDCLQYSDSELLQLLENYALREGVFADALVDAVQRSHQMLMKLKNHSIYQNIQQAQQRYHEVPFTQTTSVGTLHGVIDLLYQDQNGTWHLLDWKTEWSPKAETEENAQEHLMQMAAYSQAIQGSMGVEPEVGICFMVPETTYHSLSINILNDAWDEIKLPQDNN